MNINEKRDIEAMQTMGEARETRKETVSLRLIGLGIFEAIVSDVVVGAITHNYDGWVFVAAHDISAQDQAEIERILETLNG